MVGRRGLKPLVPPYVRIPHFVMSLHYQTRRQFCRLGFLSCCALPTAGVVAWATWLNLPAHVSGASAQLGRELQAPVSVQAASYPQPGLAQYDQVVVSHPETRQPLLRAARVEVGSNGTSQVLIVTQPELDAAALPRLLKLIEARLQATPTEVRIHAAELTLRWPDRNETLTDLVATLGTLEGEPSAALQFRVQGQEMPQAARVRLFRRADEPAATGFQIDTGDTPLPAWLAVPIAPWLEQWGEQVAWRGQIVAEETSAGWQGELSGVLSGVQINRLMAGRFPHRFDGLANVHLERARFSQGRLESATGTFVAGPGFIGKSLVAAAVGTLDMTYGDPATVPEALLPYDQLAFAFSMDSRGLQLRGHCDSGPEGAIAVDRGQLLLGQSARDRQPVSALIRALLSPSEPQVPASRQSAWLLQFLPLPQ